jgi:phage terminase small subunit
MTKIDHESTVEVPEDMGPAMLACTAAQQRFVVAWVELGGDDKQCTLAASMAGYAGTENALRVAASRLRHNPLVLAAMREMADRMLRSGAVLGAASLKDIARDALHKDRFKASVELLNRAGLLVETQHRLVIQNDNRTTAQIRHDVEAAMARLYPPGTPIPAALMPPVDVEFVEVKREKEEVLSSNGLEDIL